MEENYRALRFDDYAFNAEEFIHNSLPILGLATDEIHIRKMSHHSNNFEFFYLITRQSDSLAVEKLDMSD